jgi:TonB family protein
MKRIFSVAIFFLLTCALVYAQAPVPVNSSMIPPRLLTQPAPRFNPMPGPLYGGARVDRTVVIAVTIDQTGHVSSAQVVSGPAPLKAVAMDAVRQYTFTPAMLHGQPVAIKMDIKIDFHVNSQPHEARGWGKFMKAFKKCQEQIEKPGTPSDQVEACGNAAQLADALPDDAPTFEPITAYVQYATALIRNGKAADAVPVGNKAIALSKQPETLLTLCASYEVTGEASALSGHLKAADQYLTQAEECESRELQLPTTPPLKQHDSQVMKGLLQFHANVLASMGNQKEAASKLSQAAKL